MKRLPVIDAITGGSFFIFTLAVHSLKRLDSYGTRSENGDGSWIHMFTNCEILIGFNNPILLHIDSNHSFAKDLKDWFSFSVKEF